MSDCVTVTNEKFLFVQMSNLRHQLDPFTNLIDLLEGNLVKGPQRTLLFKDVFEINSADWSNTQFSFADNLEIETILQLFGAALRQLPGLLPFIFPEVQRREAEMCFTFHRAISLFFPSTQQ